MLNIDRYWMGRYVLEHILSNCGIDRNDYELIILDNGSKDNRTIEYLSNIADTFIKSEENIGCAKGFNKLFRLAKGDYICLIGNDILLSDGWLKELIYYNETIENSGICGVYCEGEKGNLVNKNGHDVYMRPSNTIDGITLFNRKLLDIVGGFNEAFGMFGFEDNEFSYRVSMAVYLNYYIPFTYSTHLGFDLNKDTEYRKMKNKAIEISSQKYIDSVDEIRKTGIFKIPL